MKKLLLLGLLCCLGLAVFYHYKTDRATASPLAGSGPAPKSAGLPADPIFTYPPPVAQLLTPVVVSQPALEAYLRTIPTHIRVLAKTRNVEFMSDCEAALVAHVRQFSTEGQRAGLTLAQLQDNNDAFVGKVVADLRDGYDKEEEEEHKNDPKNPLTGKSVREEAEIYHCGLKNYLPLFNNLLATKPVVTILTQPDAASVFVAEPAGYRSLGVSRLAKPMQAGTYTLVFTKPGYQSARKTFAAQRIPVQVFRTTLLPVATR